MPEAPDVYVNSPSTGHPRRRGLRGARRLPTAGWAGGRTAPSCSLRRDLLPRARPRARAPTQLHRCWSAFLRQSGQRTESATPVSGRALTFSPSPASRHHLAVGAAAATSAERVERSLESSRSSTHRTARAAFPSARAARSGRRVSAHASAAWAGPMWSGREPRSPAADRHEHDVQRSTPARGGSCPSRRTGWCRRPPTGWSTPTGRRWPWASLGRCGMGRPWCTARTSRTWRALAHVGPLLSGPPGRPFVPATSDVALAGQHRHRPQHPQRPQLRHGRGAGGRATRRPPRPLRRSGAADRRRSSGPRDGAATGPSAAGDRPARSRPSSAPATSRSPRCRDPIRCDGPPDPPGRMTRGTAGCQGDLSSRGWTPPRSPPPSSSARPASPAAPCVSISSSRVSPFSACPGEPSPTYQASSRSRRT